MKLLQILFADLDLSTPYYIIIGIISIIALFELISLFVRDKDKQTRDRRAIRRGDLHD